jgi:hypothetical protein
MSQVEHYWIFASLCLAFVILLLRLVLRERITLQGSLAYLLLLTGLSFVAVFPSAMARLSEWVGFSLPSNFLFASALGALALLHVTALITLSRVELRSIALTQELALVKEQLDRVAREAKSGQGSR